MRLIAASVLALAIAGCGDKLILAGPTIFPFATLADAKVIHKLTLFGGSGQWDITLSATVHNTTTQPHTLARRAFCTVMLQAYTNPDGTGTPAWREDPIGCKSPTVIDTIAPGDSLVLAGTHTSSTQILAGNGTPNPPGTYYFYSLFPTDIPGDTVHQFVGFASLTR